MVRKGADVRPHAQRSILYIHMSNPPSPLRNTTRSLAKEKQTVGWLKQSHFMLRAIGKVVAVAVAVVIIIPSGHEKTRKLPQ